MIYVLIRGFLYPTLHALVAYYR